MRNKFLTLTAGGLLLIGTSLAGLLAAADTKGDPEKGKEVFEQCGVCHNTDTDEKKIGPSLKGLYKHDKLKNGKRVTDENVKAMINAGGNGMPAYADLLSEAEKANVIAYLKTL
jgi:cytochrome c